MESELLRKDFPLLKTRKEHGKPLAYLDNAATAQRPACVIEAVRAYEAEHNASPHRGAYALSAEATTLYEGVRERTAKFLNAASPNEIVFTKSATEALNLVAQGYVSPQLQAGDEVVLSIAEHHSNLLPWQAAAKRAGAVLKYMYLNGEGQITQEEIENKITAKTKVVAITHTSNVLGLQSPVAAITNRAHEMGAVVVMDAAQGVPHAPIDVRALNVDFAAFSGHKMYAPGGVGVLYGKATLLAGTQPLLLGGGIVEQVTEQDVRLLDPPHRFEAGTPDTEAVVGLGVAIEYLQAIGFDAIAKREKELTAYMMQALRKVPNIEIYGGDEGRCAIAAFNIEGAHPHDVASILDAAGVAIRAGHHCAQPLMAFLGIHSCCRASVAFYNTHEDIDRLAEALGGVRGWLGL